MAARSSTRGGGANTRLHERLRKLRLKLEEMTESLNSNDFKVDSDWVVQFARAHRIYMETVCLGTIDIKEFPLTTDLFQHVLQHPTVVKVLDGGQVPLQPDATGVPLHLTAEEFLPRVTEAVQALDDKMAKQCPAASASTSKALEEDVPVLQCSVDAATDPVQLAGDETADVQNANEPCEALDDQMSRFNSAPCQPSAKATELQQTAKVSLPEIPMEETTSKAPPPLREAKEEIPCDRTAEEAETAQPQTSLHKSGVRAAAPDSLKASEANESPEEKVRRACMALPTPARSEARSAAPAIAAPAEVQTATPSAGNSPDQQRRFVKGRNLERGEPKFRRMARARSGPTGMARAERAGDCEGDLAKMRKNLSSGWNGMSPRSRRLAAAFDSGAEQAPSPDKMEKKSVSERRRLLQSRLASCGFQTTA